MFNLKFKWTTSKARDSYGYNICTLFVNNERRTRCNGGGYDMQGTCLGNWIARQFEKKLLEFKKDFYGLTFHNPNWKPSEEIIEREEQGKSLGLERYQDFYKQASKLPTKKHTIPQIDGACGFGSVTNILNHIGHNIRLIDYDCGVYLVE